MLNSNSSPQDNGGKNPDKRWTTDNNSRVVLPESNLPVNSQVGCFLIHKNQPISYHPIAERAPRDEKHRARLRASLLAKGQMEPIKVLLIDGQPQIVDGVTRTEELFALDQPVFASVLTDAERHGLSLAAWIVAKNLSASEGRQLNDTQRALLASGASEEIEKAAQQRKKSGVPVSDDERGTTQDVLARIANVTGNRIRDARLVAAYGELYEAAWNGEVPLSTAAKIATVSNKRDRRLALNAAKEKDQGRLHEILENIGSPAVPPNQGSSSQAKKPVPSAKSWRKPIKQLYEIIDWIRETANKSAGRVLATTASTEPLLEMVEKIEASKPHTLCPCCKHFPEGHCAFCAGSGWLTSEEYERYEAESTASFARQIKKQNHENN